MLDAAEAARRRELHRRAYAPGGSLTDAEVVELHDLDTRSLMRRAEPEAVEVPEAVEAREAVALPDEVAPPEAPAPPAPLAPLAADNASQDDAAGSAVPAGRDSGVEPGGGAAPGRRPRWILAVVAAVSVLVGLGGGWLLFGAGAGGMMTAAQQKVWSDLEASGDYDPGSIHLVGEKYGATTWTATQQDAKKTCILLTRKDLDPVSGCRSADGDYEGFDLQVNLDYTEGGQHYLLFAMLIEDASGKPVTIIQRQNMTDGGWDWRSQYDKDELADVDVLVGAGFVGQSLNLIGYDGATRVWLYQADRTCVLVVRGGADVEQQCGTMSTDPNAPLELVSGEVTYSVRDSNRGPMLTVIHTPASIVCDVDSGYCASVDDTTGKIG